MAKARTRRDAPPRPESDLMRSMFESMWLIRRFEERAAEEYMKGRIGGFLHLAIGEEAAVGGLDRRAAPHRPHHLDVPGARPGARARRPTPAR